MNTNRFLTRRLGFFTTPALMMLVITNTLTVSNAQIRTWTGSVDDQFYSIAGNWSPNGIPNNANEIWFTGASTASSGLRIFNGLGVGAMRVLDGTTVNFRPEGVFSSTTLEVGGSSTGNSGSFTTLNLLDFNNGTRLSVAAVEVGGFNPMLQTTGNFGNMQVNAGTTFDTNILVVGSSGNTGFLSAIGGGSINASQLFVGRNVINTPTSGSIMIQGAGATLNVSGHTIVGQTFPGGAPTDGTLHSAGGAVFLTTVDVGSGSDAAGTVSASFDGVVMGSTFNLGTIDGEGVGMLIASSGGSIFADQIHCRSDNSLIEVDQGGSIMTTAIVVDAGRLRVNGGYFHTDSELKLQSNSQFDMSSGIAEFLNLCAQENSSIDWMGGEIQLTQNSDLIVADEGLFDRQTIIPSDGKLTTSGSIDVIGELQVDGVLSTPCVCCTGNLILNDATIDGEAELSDSCQVSVDGAVTFNDTVVGGGQFFGANSTVRFLNLYAPETDLGGPTTIHFDGNVEFALGSFVALAVVNSNQFDRLQIGGDLQISGDVLFGFPENFELDPGEEIFVIETDGTVAGEFSNLPDGSIFTAEGGTQELVISYFGGDGNDIVLRPTILLGDVNSDGFVNLLDVQPFVTLITNAAFQPEADINGDGVVNLLDVEPFVSLLAN